MFIYKGILSAIVVVIALSLTGCYTQLLVRDNGLYEDNSTIIIINPAPPCPFPVPPPPSSLTYNPPQREPIIKDRQPDPPPPPSNSGVRDRLRNTGGRSDDNKGNRR